METKGEFPGALSSRVIIFVVVTFAIIINNANGAHYPSTNKMKIHFFSGIMCTVSQCKHRTNL